jgi:hypothetical protein
MDCITGTQFSLSFNHALCLYIAMDFYLYKAVR